MTNWLAQCASGMEHLRQELEHQTGQTQKAVIEEHCEAYISDKAAQLGLHCRVEVDCAYHADGLWLPEAVRLWGEIDDVSQSRLTEWMEQQFGVAAEDQTYYRTEGGRP